MAQLSLRIAVIALAVAAAACALHAAKIPGKAAYDLQCPEPSLTVMELGEGDTGPHLVRGCGKRATYELNPLGDWVLRDVVRADPTYVRPEPPPDSSTR